PVRLVPGAAPEAGSRAAPASSAPSVRPSASAAARPQPSAASERPAETGAKPSGAAAATADWPAIVQSLDLRGPARQLADSCDLKTNAGGAWQLVMPADKEH